MSHNTPFPRPRQSTQRVTQIAYPYFKLAAWDTKIISFRDGKHAFPSYDDARKSAKNPGRYRISKVTREGREDSEPFDV